MLSSFQQIGEPDPDALEQMLNPKPPVTPDYLKVLHGRMNQKGPSDACWMGQDKGGNTILHLVVSLLHVACIGYMLNHAFGTRSLQTRNNRGEPPLELRTQKEINGLTLYMSDKFRGHSESAVRCLILLKRLGSINCYVSSHGVDALPSDDRRMHMPEVRERISESKDVMLPVV